MVLLREGVQANPVLLRALSARGLRPTVVHDEPAAMVSLADLSQRQLGRRVLIVVEPGRWPRVDQLVDAVRGFHGSVHCWQFDAADGAAPMLSQLEADDAKTHRGNGQAGLGPVGRIRRRTRPVDRLLVSAPGRELSTREVVTQQELTMLLGPAPGEAG